MDLRTGLCYVLPKLVAHVPDSALEFLNMPTLNDGGTLSVMFENQTTDNFVSVEIGQSHFTAIAKINGQIQTVADNDWDNLFGFPVIPTFKNALLAL